MPVVADVDFIAVDAIADRYAAAPMVMIRMRAEELAGVPVHAATLRCQVRIDPLQRRYSDAEAAKVVDLFGGRERWGSSMHALQLAFVTQTLGTFRGSCEFDLPLPLSYDVDVAANKYLASLEEGEIPLTLMFSGTVFGGSPGTISVQPVPWHKEARFRLPVSVWREAIDSQFGGQPWLRLTQDAFDRLSAFRTRHGLPNWDEAINLLLRQAP